jgi:septal ring factor EnvC (AmiA/AmiB activator)
MQIILTRKQIKVYQTEINRKNRNITNLKKEIELLRNKISHLEIIFKKQIVFAYKYQRGRQLDWLLGAKNLTNMIIRNRYFQIISAAEKNNYEQLTLLQNNLGKKENSLVAELSTLNNLLVEANEADKNLQTKRSSKSDIIYKVRNNRTLTQNLLKEKRESEKQLLNLIVNLEKGRSTRKLSTSTQLKWERLTGSFAKNRGKLNWPVTGNILHNFGRYRNPQLKTTLNNSGIDIKAKNGTEVRTVFSGVISMITYKYDNLYEWIWKYRYY